MVCKESSSSVTNIHSCLDVFVCPHKTLIDITFGQGDKSLSFQRPLRNRNRHLYLINTYIYDPFFYNHSTN